MKPVKEPTTKELENQAAIEKEEYDKKYSIVLSKEERLHILDVCKENDKGEVR